ncbi:MAG: aldehyde dehydrogenase family protein [Bdellovibrionales bacterium]|nr:aldehyde dehydrogenase family protein [Bdellovibrionales bacterium]
MEDIKNISDELLSVLNKNKESIIRINSEETGYDLHDIELLWGDLENYLLNCHALYDKSTQLWSQNNTLYQTWEESSKHLRLPWGKVLVCTPSNSIIPLLPIIISSFCSVGNQLIVAPSRKVLKTTELILNHIQPILTQNNWKITLFKGGGRAALDEFIEKSKIDLLYFQGSSRNRVNVYTRCISNGIDIIFEGEGNQVTIIDEIPASQSITAVAETIRNAKMFCKGQLCTSPNVVFIHKNIATPLIVEYKKLATDCNYYKMEEIKSLINSESFSPVLNFAEYSNLEEVIDLLKSNYRYGLQISIFGNRTDRLEKCLLSEIHFSRLTINMNPTIQNSLLPWGGYKKSGYSPVVNFFEKATKKIIIEYGQS